MQTKQKTKKICPNCKNEFFVSPSRLRLKYCGSQCYWETLRGVPPYQLKNSDHLIGNKFRQGKKPVNAFAKGHVPWNKGKKYKAISGHKNPNWKGGVTKENDAIRKSIEYKNWRIAVFKRDNYTCHNCGCNKSNHLNAEHILPFSLFPDHRLNLDNGKTLCVDCHKKTYSYLNSNIRKEDYQLIVLNSV